LAAPRHCLQLRGAAPSQLPALQQRRCRRQQQQQQQQLVVRARPDALASRDETPAGRSASGSSDDEIIKSMERLEVGRWVGAGLAALPALLPA
jgi:hypothetical protein